MNIAYINGPLIAKLRLDDSTRYCCQQQMRRNNGLSTVAGEGLPSQAGPWDAGDVYVYVPPAAALREED
eukprot:scaffold267768_cov18-Prasinocladus_malaysianus.AAC.1